MAKFEGAEQIVGKLVKGASLMKEPSEEISCEVSDTENMAVADYGMIDDSYSRDLGDIPSDQGKAKRVGAPPRTQSPPPKPIEKTQSKGKEVTKKKKKQSPSPPPPPPPKKKNMP